MNMGNFSVFILSLFIIFIILFLKIKSQMLNWIFISKVKIRTIKIQINFDIFLYLKKSLSNNSYNQRNTYKKG